MLAKSILCIVVGLGSGLGVSAGTFAFLLVIRVLPRMIQKANIEHKIMYVESLVTKGVLFGCAFTFFHWEKGWLAGLFGSTLLTFYGLSSGIFTGCIAVALAEILDTFPIFFCRLRIKESFCEELLFVMAVGKMLGSLFYFFMGYGTIAP